MSDMMSLPSQMSHSFSQIPKAEIPRASFNRNFSHKTTFNSGFLIPIFVDEALPGDTFHVKMTAFARLATPIVPIMDNMFMDTFFFFVPNRLIWDHWQEFNGEQKNPADSTDYLVPQMAAPAVTGVQTGELCDYMGIPIKAPGLLFNSLHTRAYNLIWNEWFRDQNLQNSVTVDLGDGPDTYSNYVLLRRGKRHDYFTSCLPWPQKGPAVDLPLGTVAPVISTGATPTFSSSSGSQNSNMQYFATSVGRLATATGLGSDGTNVKFGNVTGLEADLSSAIAPTINSIRQAFQVQKMYERDARGGTRYTEIIRAHFGVISPDARLQRPEYLGGTSNPIYINPIAQTSATQTGVDTPQGNLAAIGTATIRHNAGNGFVKSFVEHGVIIGLVAVRADLTYQQGLNRMWSRQTRFDYYWPALSHLGEQNVLNKEIFATGTNTTQDNATFGYQERYGEYRYYPSMITGLFRSTATDPLDVWHLAQDFSTLPALNSTFIQDNPPVDRIVAVDNQPQFLFDSFFDMQCARPMPVFGVPGLVDHF